MSAATDGVVSQRGASHISAAPPRRALHGWKDAALIVKAWVANRERTQDTRRRS